MLMLFQLLELKKYHRLIVQLVQYALNGRLLLIQMELLLVIRYAINVSIWNIQRVSIFVLQQECIKI